MAKHSDRHIPQERWFENADRVDFSEPTRGISRFISGKSGSSQPKLEQPSPEIRPQLWSKIVTASSFIKAIPHKEVQILRQLFSYKSVPSARVLSHLAPLFWCSCLVLGFAAAAWAEDYQNGFEGEEISCRVDFNRRQVALKLHERNQTLAFAGQGAERIQFVAHEHDAPVSIECEMPPSRILDELTISVNVFCNRPGLQIFARVIFPNQKDPVTGRPLARVVAGETLEKPNSWQKISCRTTDDVIAKHLILWRGSLKPAELDPRGMYIDHVVLKQTLGPGMTEILLDDLRVGPVVKPNQQSIIAPADLQPRAAAPQIRFQLDQLQVQGRPFFPIVIPYQKEPVDLFKKLGANVVWIDNYLNRDMIDQFNRQGVWATAWPPSAKSNQGEILDAREANLVPFGRETDGILFWNLGVRIEPETHAQLKHWVHQVKSSDREQNRPILADVTGDELIFSRDVEMLGVSKHILQSPYSFRDYASHLQERKQLAQPGTFVMTWLQTEPSRAVTQYRKAAGLSPAVIEPEQIRLQTYAALCAGCKGIGFWNWTPLNAEGPGYKERRLVLEQLCQEVNLLEPFLASGEVIHRFDIALESTAHEKRNEEISATKNSRSRVANESLSAAAAVVRSEHGLLILLNGMEDNAQYVPGPMGQSDVRVMIRGLPESAFLWQITPTGLWPLETRRVTGGTEIRLPRFNMTAALMVATDQGVAQEIEREIQKIQVRSAELAIELAEEKFGRVLEVDERLMQASVGLPEATHLLDESRRSLDIAREAFTKEQYHQARTSAELTCQLLRILQRLYWQQAVRHVSAPTSMPHTICFQTLPDYWKLIQQLGKANSAASSHLRSGRFEDPDAMLVEGWTKDVTSSKEVIVYDALDPETAHEGDYCLRMASIPSEAERPVKLQEPAVTYRSPVIPVKQGDLLYVTGWVRLARPISGGLEGFRIYDSQYGVASCLKWSDQSDWQQFELIRPIWKQEDLHLFLELHGLGDVSVDDLQVKLLRLDQSDIVEVKATDETDAPEEAKSKGNALDFLNRFIK